MPAAENSKLVEVFAGTSSQVAIVKSLLESADIQAFVKDSIMGTLAPWYASPGGAGSVKVFVTDNDLELAREVVRDYEANINQD